MPNMRIHIFMRCAMRALNIEYITVNLDRK